ncbi:MAG: single-stranded DNA-binding protein [Candidatus Margulisiibacteriota bacterium]
MSSLNRIILIGTVSSDPDPRATAGGDSFLRFNLSVDRPMRADGLAGQPDDMPVVAWRQTADQAKGIQKGQLVLVDGKIITRTLDDAQGKRKWITEIEAKDIRSFAGGVVADAPAYVPAQPEAFSAPFPSDSLEKKQVSMVEESDFDFGEEIPF